MELAQYLDTVAEQLVNELRPILAIKGVTEGYQEILEVKGIGYKVSLKDNKLEFLLGKSHPIILDIPKELKVKVEGSKIIIKGVNKQQVRKFAVNDIKSTTTCSNIKRA